MALLSFGGSKSSQSSSAKGVSFGVGASESASSSVEQARAKAGGRSQTSVAFADVFAQLFGDASNVAGRIAGEPINTEAASLFSGGLDFLAQLEDGGVAGDYLEGRVSGQGSTVDDQIALLQRDLGEFFAEEVNPVITGDAVAGYSLGGGRQGVAQGQAAEALLEEFTRGATALRTADVAQRDQAARDLLSSRIQGASAGLAALPGVFGLAEAERLSALAPYQALAGILGAPTVVGESETFSESSSDAIAQALSRAFSTDFSYNTAQSSGKSKSFSLGFG